MEPTTFASMSEAAKAISVGEGVIRYVWNNGWDFMRRFKGGSIQAFLIKWCHT